MFSSINSSQNNQNPPTITCPECKGYMRYKGSGRYVCEECGYEHYTEFGLVKRYINENGPGTAIEIEAATGVHRKKIQEFLREGRLEAVNSPFDPKN